MLEVIPDQTLLGSLRTARRKKKSRATSEEQQGLPQASGGRKESCDEKGNVTKVVEWFGFKLHLLVDVKHEVSLAYKITGTSAGDGETLPAILEDAHTAAIPTSRGLPPAIRDRERIQNIARLPKALGLSPLAPQATILSPRAPKPGAFFPLPRKPRAFLPSPRYSGERGRG